jgi:glycosyltransferase involved in cell wall biosynthesis
MSGFVTQTRPSTSTTTPSATARAQARPPRLRVLVSAYAVSPVRGSEPGLGWNLVSRLANYHDITVLCAPNVPGLASQNFRAEIAQYERDNGPVPGLTIHFVEPPLLSRWFQRESRIRRRTVYYTGYAAWQRAAYRDALMLHEQQPFDIVHHLNITGYREPGYLWRMPVPFVWGPVGGAADIPAAFFPLMGWQDRLFYTFRNRMNALQKRTLRRPRAAALAARHVWAIGEENRALLCDEWGRRDIENMIESGATIRADVSPRSFDGTRRLRLAWSGQHIGRKALPILLHAMARANVPTEAVVLGEGAETARWKALSRSLGLAAHVRWLGQLPHAVAQTEVSRADAFVLTSLQEGTPHVVLEALALGVPVLCHDACGMGVAVNQLCGIKIPMRDPETSIAGFANAIRLLSQQPARVNEFYRGALRRAAELSWDSKAEQIARTYSQVVPSPSTAGSRA